MKEEQTLKCRCLRGDCPAGHPCGYLCYYLQETKPSPLRVFVPGKSFSNTAPPLVARLERDEFGRSIEVMVVR
jgi:hypothetical protein